MEKENRIILGRIILTAVLLAAVKVADVLTALPIWAYLVLYLIPYLLISYDILKEAGENIIHGRVFDETFLMVIATVGAFAIGFIPGAEPEFTEGVLVMLLFRVGELFEDIAEGNSRRSVAELMNIRPDSACVERDGETVAVSPESVAIGEIILVKPGERIPLDGVIVEGISSLDTVALTGESVPKEVTVDDSVVSGCINQSGVLRIKVTKEYAESTVSKILELVENASECKSKSENFIDKFARIYTPIVVISAVAVALLPPIISGDFAGNIAVWLHRALTFLVISCPCALVISVPLTFFGGIGGASRHGILIKGSNYIETLAKAGTVVFDKTGTLTHGVFRVTAVHPENCDENKLLHLAAHVERYSTHPIALSLRQAYGNEADGCDVTNVREISGEGIEATVNGKNISVGNEKLMNRINAKWHECTVSGTIVHVAVDGEYAGHIVISDKVKDDSKAAVEELRRIGVDTTVMLTGDRYDVAKFTADTLALDGFYAELMPADKVEKVKLLLEEKKASKTLLFVGDGINDAPVLAYADAGVAMGALGSDAAIEAADVVLMDDKPSGIAKAIKISRKTLRIAKENIIFALSVKVIVLLLALFGLAPMWLAVFADVGVTVLAVINAVRAMR